MNSLLIRQANVATMAEPSGYGEILDGALFVEDGIISWVGREADLPAGLNPSEEIDAAGRWLTPGLIDCHTHLVWAGNRSNEFEMRMGGSTYRDIAAAGGGILSTVRNTRGASYEELVAWALPRLQALKNEGVTTVEIKSGYGLDLDTELKCLSAARQLGVEAGIEVAVTYLGAHTVPPEYAGRADDYVDFVCLKVLPTIREENLAEAVDVFCETIAFSASQSWRILDKAKSLGFKIKLHADQLSDSEGARLIADLGGLSADHVEYTSEESVQAMAASGTVAVVLPGAFYMLRETRKPPIDLFRTYGVPIAVATDCNPGTSPCTSLLLMLNMACVLFGLTPAEALAGVTVHAAKALGKQEVIGSLKAGMRADMALFSIDHPRDLAASIGMRTLHRSWSRGRNCA